MKEDAEAPIGIQPRSRPDRHNRSSGCGRQAWTTYGWERAVWYAHCFTAPDLPRALARQGADDHRHEARRCAEDERCRTRNPALHRRASRARPLRARVRRRRPPSRRRRNRSRHQGRNRGVHDTRPWEQTPAFTGLLLRALLHGCSHVLHEAIDEHARDRGEFRHARERYTRREKFALHAFETCARAVEHAPSRHP